MSHENGNTPLHIASLEVIKALVPQDTLQHSAWIMLSLMTPKILYEKNNDGDTPLHVALKNKSSEEIVRSLLVSEVLGMKNNTGETPLHVALRYDAPLEAVKWLSVLSDINAKNNYGDTPLQTALRYKCSQEVVNVLTKAGKFKNGVSLDVMEFLIGQKFLNFKNS